LVLFLEVEKQCRGESAANGGVEISTRQEQDVSCLSAPSGVFLVVIVQAVIFRKVIILKTMQIYCYARKRFFFLSKCFNFTWSLPEKLYFMY
jgi:hypothetical protein